MTKNLVVQNTFSMGLTARQCRLDIPTFESRTAALQAELNKGGVGEAREDVIRHRIYLRTRSAKLLAKLAKAKQGVVLVADKFEFGTIPRLVSQYEEDPSTVVQYQGLVRLTEAGDVVELVPIDANMLPVCRWEGSLTFLMADPTVTRMVESES